MRPMQGILEGLEKRFGEYYSNKKLFWLVSLSQISKQDDFDEEKQYKLVILNGVLLLINKLSVNLSISFEGRGFSK